MNKYWVGGTGNWSDATNHWATSSGGSPGAGNTPTASDSVFFDANSGVGTVTIDAAAVCLDFNQDALSTITTFAGTATLAISGSFTLGLLTTWSATGTITFNATTTGKTITTTGTTINSSVIFNGIGGGWTLQDNWTSSTKSWTLTNGSLDTNGKSVSLQAFSSNNSNTRTLTLGASAITIGGSGTNWAIIANNLTLNAGTSTITQGTSNSGFSGGLGLTYYNLVVNLGSFVPTFTFQHDNTFNNVTLNGGAGKITNVVFYADQIINGTLTITGNSAINRILVRSSVVGIVRTITAATVSLANVDFNDITGAGVASPFTGTSIGNALGNSGITFTTPTTRYWVDVDGGSWSATTSWSTSSGGASGASVPLCHDTVIFDANSITSGSRTITADMPRLGAGVDFSAITNNPTLTFSIANFIFGALTIGSGMTITSNTNTTTLSARSSVNLTSNGVTFGNPLTISVVGGTIILVDNLILNTARTLTLTDGELDAGTNNVNVTVGLFSYTGTRTRTLTMGSGTWTVNGTGTVWSAATVTNLTLNAGTSMIIVSDTSSVAKTFAGGGLTYNNITFSGDNISVTGANVFNTFAINTAGLANGLKLSANQTVTNLTTNGSVGNLAKLLSSSVGTKRTITKAAGGPQGRRVHVQYMTITDSTVDGGEWFLSGAGSSLSNTTGWILNVPPPRQGFADHQNPAFN